MHRNATQAKEILERMAKRHPWRKPRDGAVWVNVMTEYDLREVRRAIRLLEKTDLRTRRDKGTHRTKGKRRR